MEKSVERDEVIARSRRALLQHVPHFRRHRRFRAHLVDRKRFSAFIEPGLFFEVFETAVKPTMPSTRSAWRQLLLSWNLSLERRRGLMWSPKTTAGLN